MSDNKKKGTAYEEKAAIYLEKFGLKILERNFRCKLGEIDLIGMHHNQLVFVEVKYRRTNRSGTPEEAVGINKQLKICHSSDYYRAIHPASAHYQIRYDVVAILGNQINWYQNAFSYQRRGMSWL